MGVRSALAFAGRRANEAVSFVVFCALDILDMLLCVAYKLADYAKEAEWRPCYCSAAVAGAGGGKIVVCVCSSSKLRLADVSATLFSRPSVISRRLPRRGGTTVVQIGAQRAHPTPRWSDCDCKACAPAGPGGGLYVRAQGPEDGEAVLFIHGFISSSGFWAETVFPNLSGAAVARYRLLAVDLLGFGRSPRPADSLYTMSEHVEMIERSVIDRYGVKSFHIVAHSLGSVLALALAVKHPDSVLSLTLLAPPYFPVPKGEEGAQYVMRRVAPRRVWPPIAFGASLACWYEHISRTICLLICKHHRLWESSFKFLTRHRVKTFLLEGFFSHTHNAAWHTLHNIICGSAGKIEGYLNVVRDRVRCPVTVIHGRNDELLPVDCSVAVKSRIPRADLRIVDGKDHITVVVGRQQAFARELEEIWNNSGTRH